MAKKNDRNNSANGKTNDLENKLWKAADQLWANSNLRPEEFSTPVLGLIFLRYADHRYTGVEKGIGAIKPGSRRAVSKTYYQSRGVMFQQLWKNAIDSRLNFPPKCGIDVVRE